MKKSPPPPPRTAEHNKKQYALYSPFPYVEDMAKQFIKNHKDAYEVYIKHVGKNDKNKRIYHIYVRAKKGEK